MTNRPKPPRGCFWRGHTLWGRARIAGRLVRWSLHTEDPEVAALRRQSRRNQLASEAYHEEQRLASSAFATVESLRPIEGDDLVAIMDRVEKRQVALGSPRRPGKKLSDRATSVAAGLCPDYLRGLRRQHARGVQSGITTRAAIKLAGALRTTPSWLLHGRGPETAENAPSRTSSGHRELRVIWTVSAERERYFVVESLDDVEINRWGPLPSMGLAHGVIDERKKLVQDRIKISIGSIQADRA